MLCACKNKCDGLSLFLCVCLAAEHGGEVSAVRVHPHHDSGAALHAQGGRDGEQGRARGGATVLGAPAKIHGGRGSKPQVSGGSSLALSVHPSVWLSLSVSLHHTLIAL